jgi:hypothetical protein
MDDQPGALDEAMVPKRLVVVGVLDVLVAEANRRSIIVWASGYYEYRMTYAQGRLQRLSSWPSGTTFSLNLLFNTLEVAINLIANGHKSSLATTLRIDPMEGRSL